MQGSLSFLPPKGLKARKLAFALLALGPLFFGALAVWLGQDANWDFRNYHWYNAFAFLNGRYDIDVQPSQIPFFYNPAIDVPFYVLAQHVSAKTAAFILGVVQGLNFPLLFMLAYASLRVPRLSHKVFVCAGLSFLGMLGGGGIAQIGTTFYDNVLSLGLFASALLSLRFWRTLNDASWSKALALAVLCGLPAGLMMGLKLPVATFCIGLCGAFLLVAGPLARRVWIAFGFGLGVLLGLAVAYGPWAAFLISQYGSPVYPYFNGLFPTPFDPPAFIRDIKFVQTAWLNRLFLPFLFAFNPLSVGEIPWQDFRIPVLYGFLPVAIVGRLLFGRNKNAPDRFTDYVATRYLLWFAGLSYLVWLFGFGIYRYLLPLEMLAPLLIVVAIGLMPLRTQPRVFLTLFVLLAIAATVRPGDWGRREAWLDHPVEIVRPDIEAPAQTMILMASVEPYSHVLTEFPPESAFVRVQSNYLSPEQKSGYNDMIKARVAAHKGVFKLLIPRYHDLTARDALKHFGLFFSPQSCKPVEDRLYDSQLVLCDVQRTDKVKK